MTRCSYCGSDNCECGDEDTVSIGRYALIEGRRMKSPRGQCRTCDIERDGENATQTPACGPPHDASPRCESGGKAHCSCDICF